MTGCEAGFDFGGRTLVVAVGNALVDILTRQDDAFVQRAGAAKGGMRYVDAAHIDVLLGELGASVGLTPGGSACNTAAGIGHLGGRVRFVGKIGRDRLGVLFDQGLRRSCVEPHLLPAAAPTGRVLSIVTPDAERSMLTCLGAAAEMQPAEITAAAFDAAAIALVEGYLVFNRALIVRCLETARRAGAAIALDLASYTVVQHDRTLLRELVAGFVDILLANEEEARAFSGRQDLSGALADMADLAAVAVLKQGVAGSHVVCGNRCWHVDAGGRGAALDTTGAGDLYAAGFLYALVAGHPPPRCARLGAWCGYEVCQVLGAGIPPAGWERINRLRRSWDDEWTTGAGVSAGAMEMVEWCQRRSLARNC